MWWMILLAVLVVVVLLAVLAARMAGADRRRSATWNDLHQRGKLMASQLAHLNEAASRAGAEVTPEKHAPTSAAQKMGSSRWPQHVARPGARSGRFASDPAVPV